MTIIEYIRAGRLVVVPGELRNAAAPENASDAEALRVALELMNMRQNNGTKRDDLLYEAAAFLKRRGYLVLAEADITAGLIALVEGMEAEIARMKAMRKRLDKRIHDQRKSNRTNWEIVEMRDKSLRRTAMHYIKLGYTTLQGERNAEARALAATAESDRLRRALELYREAVRVDVQMDGPKFMGSNASALKRAWEHDRRALKEQTP